MSEWVEFYDLLEKANASWPTQQNLGVVPLISSAPYYYCYVVGHINEGPVSTWMRDRLVAGKPSWYVTATEIDSAFYPPWDGKMGISFRAE